MFNLLSFMDSDAKIIHILSIILKKENIEMNRLRQRKVREKNKKNKIIGFSKKKKNPIYFEEKKSIIID